MEVDRGHATHGVLSDYAAGQAAAEFFLLNAYANWRAECLFKYRKYGIKLRLSSAVWAAITMFAKFENEYLCARLTSLPRELSDPIYDTIAEGLAQDLVIECINGFVEGETTDKYGFMDGNEKLNEWMRFSFLDKRMWNEEVFYEIMSRYYAQTSIWLTTLPAWGQGHTKLGFNLWRLLGSDALGSMCVPAKLIPKVTIELVLRGNWDVTARNFILPPADAVPIEGAKTLVVIRAFHKPFVSAKSCCRVRPRTLEPKDGRKVLAKLRPMLERMTALGLRVQLLYGGKAKLLYPINKTKEMAMQGEDAQPRSVRRPGLRELRQNVRYSA